MRIQSKAFSRGIHCYWLLQLLRSAGTLPFGQAFFLLCVCQILNEVKRNHFCANDLRSPKMVKRPMFYGAKKMNIPKAIIVIARIHLLRVENVHAFRSLYDVSSFSIRNIGF